MRLAVVHDFAIAHTKCTYMDTNMTTTRVFQNGNSQAVRIPKEFQFEATEVEIFRRGDEIVLRPHRANLL